MNDSIAHFMAFIRFYRNETHVIFNQMTLKCHEQENSMLNTNSLRYTGNMSITWTSQHSLYPIAMTITNKYPPTGKKKTPTQNKTRIWKRKKCLLKAILLIYCIWREINVRKCKCKRHKRRIYAFFVCFFFSIHAERCMIFFFIQL